MKKTRKPYTDGKVFFERLAKDPEVRRLAKLLKETTVKKPDQATHAKILKKFKETTKKGNWISEEVARPERHKKKR